MYDGLGTFVLTCPPRPAPDFALVGSAVEAASDGQKAAWLSRAVSNAARRFQRRCDRSQCWFRRSLTLEPVRRASRRMAKYGPEGLARSAGSAALIDTSRVWSRTEAAMALASWVSSSERSTPAVASRLAQLAQG